MLNWMGNVQIFNFGIFIAKYYFLWTLTPIPGMCLICFLQSDNYCNTIGVQFHDWFFLILLFYNLHDYYYICIYMLLRFLLHFFCCSHETNFGSYYVFNWKLYLQYYKACKIIRRCHDIMLCPNFHFPSTESKINKNNDSKAN